MWCVQRNSFFFFNKLPLLLPLVCQPLFMMTDSIILRMRVLRNFLERCSSETCFQQLFPTESHTSPPVKGPREPHLPSSEGPQWIRNRGFHTPSFLFHWNGLNGSFERVNNWTIFLERLYCLNSQTLLLTHTSWRKMNIDQKHNNQVYSAEAAPVFQKQHLQIKLMPKRFNMVLVCSFVAWHYFVCYCCIGWYATSRWPFLWAAGDSFHWSAVMHCLYPSVPSLGDENA